MGGGGLGRWMRWDGMGWDDEETVGGGARERESVHYRECFRTLKETDKMKKKREGLFLSPER